MIRKLFGYFDARYRRRFDAAFNDAIERDTAKRHRLTNDQGNPNINEVWAVAKDMEILRRNVKVLGADLARRALADLPTGPVPAAPRQVGLTSKCATQADMESDWAAYWAAKLKTPLYFHRKLWEHFFILQVLWEHGCLAEGRRGVGFGCGREPLPSCMAAHGASVLATDAPPDHENVAAWHGQRLSADVCFVPYIVSRDQFDRKVTFDAIDMNAIPESLAGFDFCWSACALEHLGSIANGLKFIERSIDVLKPGGCAVHTTEFNYANDDETIDHWLTVLFQKKHFTDLAERLRARGHSVAELNFDPGSQPLDRFVDVPPYTPEFTRDASGGRRLTSHMKIAIDGFASASFGLIVRKGGG